MKHKLLLPLLAALAGGLNSLPAQTTAFTYQGKLVDDCCPATGLYDLRFRLYPAGSGGGIVPGTGELSMSAVPVTNGLFTVPLEFGSTAFDGNRRWLEMDVRTNNATATRTTLSPRTELTSTPYAVRAASASTVPDNAITRPKIAPGQVVKSLNGMTDAISLVAGNNVTLTPSGNNLTIASTGGPGVFSLNGSSAYYNGGNVGIGTTSPDHPLTLQVPAGGTTHMTWRNPTYDLGALGWGTEANSGWLGLYSSGNAKVSIQANANSYFTGGNVGIGTTSPIYPLHVANSGILLGKHSASGGYTALAMRLSSEKNGYSILESVSAAGSAWGNLALNPSGGNVGIGTTSPQAKLDVNGNLRVEPNDQGNPGNVVLRAGSVDGTALYCHSYGLPFRAHNDYTGTDVVLAGALAAGFTGDIHVSGSASVCSLTIRGGCDLAEPFQMSGEKIPEGSVVVIDEENPGHLKQATHAYDTRVAGIVSGANGVKAGIALHQEGVLEGGQNVALTGRVYVKADASFGAIKPGDLLTTSDTSGHAMRVTDSSKAQGAILGKSMTALESGKGMVLVLVSLQ